MKRVYATMLTVGLAFSAFAQGNPEAVLHTSDGDITVELYPSKAPKTVENFVGLSTGKKTWTDPKSGKAVTGRPLYNGTIFHRTIPGFMIQGGDPLGNGMGGPGFEFQNEASDLTFDKAGVLAMANAGPDTNGSQFFITVGPRPQLNGGYTIFGQVTAGQDIVNKIVNKPTGAQDRPTEPTVIKNIEIKGAGAAAAAPVAATPAAPAAPATQPGAVTTTGTVPQN